MHPSQTPGRRGRLQLHWPYGRQARRGVTYILVLGTTLIVATLGLGALLSARAQARVSSTLADAAEARILALSAIELARLKIKTDTNWRTTYASGQFMTERIATPGKFYTWTILDEATGGPVTSNEMDSVRVIGKARVGSAVQLERVVLNATKVPLDVLRTTVHANDTFNCTAAITTTGGPVSTNGELKRGATITGAAESLSFSSSGTITGGLTCPAPVKPMPDQAVFDTYRSMATQIAWGGGTGNWTITWPLLSSGINPSGGATNANGIYYIIVPAGRYLELQIRRIRGTLVVECGGGSSFRQWNPVCWEPHSANFPILLVKHTTSAYVDDWIEAGAGSLVETVVAANLNPAHTPYNGSSDATIDATDIYPSQMKGLVHVMSPFPNVNRSETSIGNNVNLIGTLISDQSIWTGDGGTANLNYDPNLFANPPQGYYTVEMIPSAGSWRAEIQP